MNTNLKFTIGKFKALRVFTLAWIWSFGITLMSCLWFSEAVTSVYVMLMIFGGWAGALGLFARTSLFIDPEKILQNERVIEMFIRVLEQIKRDDKNGQWLLDTMVQKMEGEAFWYKDLISRLDRHRQGLFLVSLCRSQSDILIKMATALTTHWDKNGIALSDITTEPMERVEFLESINTECKSVLNST